jgi:Domain of unknown function (DUF4832)/Domain of unknown function (DUF4874)
MMHRYKYCLWTIGYLARILLGGTNDQEQSALAAIPVADLAVATTKPATSSNSTSSYQPTTSEFPNPERGFHDEIELMTGEDFSNVRRKGYTIARTYIRLDEYRNRALPAKFLTQLDRQFQLVRSAGIKVIPRFSYNFPTDAGDLDKAPDASLTLTIEHINQLKPILWRNADVIAVLQGGFIGAWGEWHSSQHELDQPQAKAKILNALLTAMPTNRMVQIRYPHDIQTNYPQALSIAAAFRGSRQARVGFKNDCFLANQSDAGTYKPDLPTLKSYISKISPFVVVGGETCQVTPAEHRSDCPTAEAELARFHWSYLNANFYTADLDRWRKEGCYSKIASSLGYRFQLVRSSFPTQAQRNRQLTGNFVIKNMGYASPFNPRGLELILRHRSTGQIYHLPILKSLSRTHDPRFWLPQVGEIAVDVRAKIPPAATIGTYDLLLNLPDPMPKLSNRPEYSIRLANEQIWEAKTGFNSLRRTIQLVK